MSNNTIKNKVFVEKFNGRNVFVERLTSGKHVIYVSTGNAAMLVDIEEANSVELEAALGIDDVDFEQDNLAARLASLAGITIDSINMYDGSPYYEEEKSLLGYIAPTAKVPAPTADDAEVPALTAEVPAEYTNDFDNAVERLSNLAGFQFIMLMNYAKSHHNNFPKFSGFVGVVNADDAYCTCIINMTRKYGECLEKKAFDVLTGDKCTDDEKAEFFEALKIINK